ncbi:hypothetical protein GCM10010439_58650 [Actinocorallia aurantiaca]|uniref:Uncharacterized protein n=1 Tax=Actinocorallia aurantiaca TaxID=46204 RepID=A0ABN3UL78_9ACTN
MTTAGILMEPPPSLAWATGTMPAATATAAADPPLEPPTVCGEIESHEQLTFSGDGAGRGQEDAFSARSGKNGAISWSRISGWR